MRVKTLSSLVAVTGMLLSFAAQAQEPPAGGEAAPATPAPTTPAPITSTSGSKGLIGGDFALAIPFGNLSDAAGIGLGLLARGEYGIIPNLNLTARLGFVYHLSKSILGIDVNVWEVPVLVGVKYGFTDAIYGAAEIGMVWTKVSSDAGSSSETNAAFTIGAGYRMDALDFRLGLNFIDLGHAGDSTELMLNVGYNFAKF